MNSNDASTNGVCANPIYVLVPLDNNFPWPKHGIYIEGKNRHDGQRLAERETGLYHATVKKTYDVGHYIYWMVKRDMKAVEKAARRRGRG